MKVNSLLEEVADGLWEGLALLDAQGHLVFANHSLETLLGYQNGEMLGRRWTRFLDGGTDHQPDRWRVSAVAAEPVSGEFELCHKDGRRIAATLSARVLRGSQGGRGTLVTVSDLRERRRLEGRLERLERAISASQRVSSATHELNNSLAILVLQSQILARRMKLPPESQGGLEVIHEQAIRMKHILETLLEPEDEGEASLERVDVNDLLDQTMTVLAPQLEADGIQLQTDLEGGLPAIRADANDLRHVFVNLVNNARQAIADTGRSGSLRVESCLVDSGTGSRCIQIRFVDDGPGIPPDVLPHLFEPFFSTKEIGKGMGLGLTICERILQQHGGRIWAERDAQYGATFVVELPLPPHAPERDSVVDCTSERPGTRHASGLRAGPVAVTPAMLAPHLPPLPA